MKKVVTVILAAGKGVRMKSKIPKVLQKVGGVPIIDRITQSVKSVSKKLIFVVGNNFVRKHLSKTKAQIVYQRKRLGTAHAFLKTEKLINSQDTILVLPGDIPMITKKTIAKLVEHHFREKNDITILSTVLKDPTGYGRIIKKGKSVVAIREELDTTEKEKRIKKVNAGCYVFSAAVFKTARKIRKNQRKGEYYLTDIIECGNAEGLKIGEFEAKNAEEVSGINTKSQLEKINGKFGRKQ